MESIKIKAPIWKKPRSVGIASYKITGNLKIEILYKDKSGEKLYPNPFYITKEKALSYPTQYLSKHDLTLYIIPIKDLDLEPMLI